MISYCLDLERVRSYLKDKDPSPSSKTRKNARNNIRVQLSRTIVLAHPSGAGAMVLELGEAICKNAREGGGHGADKIEDGISLLELVSRIPATEKVRTTWSVSAYQAICCGGGTDLGRSQLQRYPKPVSDLVSLSIA